MTASMIHDTTLIPHGSDNAPAGRARDQVPVEQRKARIGPALPQRAVVGLYKLHSVEP
jgi:hypothetical protein